MHGLGAGAAGACVWCGRMHARVHAHTRTPAARTATDANHHAMPQLCGSSINSSSSINTNGCSSSSSTTTTTTSHAAVRCARQRTT